MMNTHESFERIDHGLSRAASCCRELAVMAKIPAWNDLSRQLLIMRKKAKVMYAEPPLHENQVMALVTQMEIAQLNAKRMSGMQ